MPLPTKWPDKEKCAANQEQIELVSQLAEKLGVPMNNPDLWLEAVTHRSYSYFHHSEYEARDNEKLEFFGDAVLEMIVIEHLLKKYPNGDKGNLAWLRNDLVNNDNLRETAQKLGMEDFLLMNGPRGWLGKSLADVFEAIVAAIYLDSGLETAARFVAAHLFGKLPDVDAIESGAHRRAAEVFNNKALESLNIMPAYKILKVEKNSPRRGKASQKKGVQRFTVGAYLEGELVAKGIASTKSKAKARAAYKALLKKGWLDSLRDVKETESLTNY